MSTLYSIDLFGNPLASADILGVLDTTTPATGPLAGNFMVKIPDGVSVNAPSYLGTGLPNDPLGLLTQKYQGLLVYYTSFTNVVFDDLLDATHVDRTGPSVGGTFGSRSNTKLYPNGVLQSTSVTLPVLSGTAASVSSFASPLVTISGLSGITSLVVGQQITLSGAATSANNGVFTVISAVNSTTVQINNASAVAPDANDGSIHWTFPPPSQALITWETFSVGQTDVSSATVTRTYNEVPSDPANTTCEVSFNGGVNWLAVTDSMVVNIPPTTVGTSFVIKITNVSSSALNLGGWAVLY